MHMFLYHCANCCTGFAIEFHEEVDHSDAVCPICHIDDGIEEIGNITVHYAGEAYGT